MISFLVHYNIPGILTFAPLVEKVLAATEKGAKEIFGVYYTGDILFVEKAEENLNGRYTRYFCNFNL